jgi:hypothetical protein
MPRKPNYKFERHERDRAKAAKKAAKAAKIEEKRETPDEEATVAETPRLTPLNRGRTPESD